MNFWRYALVYGALAGAIVVSVIILSFSFGLDEHGVGSLWFGYLVMLVALTFVFVGVKRYRDVEKGGVVRFLPALGMGLAIALVAALAYSVIWEIYLFATDYRFMDDYIAAQLKQLQAQGVSAAELAAKSAEFEGYREIYRSPVLRFLMTMAEILPVGLIMALISATALRFPNVLPAR